MIHPYKILVIEDSKTDAIAITSALKSVFNGSGVRVDVARTLQCTRGFLLNPDNEYYAIILDLTLPDSTGINTFECVRDLSSAPMIIYTGGEDAVTQLMVASSGVPMHIKSDCTPDELARVLISTVHAQSQNRHEFNHLTKQMDAILNLLRPAMAEIQELNSRLSKLESFVPLLEEGRNVRKIVFRLLWIIIPAVLTAVVLSYVVGK